MGEVGGVNVSGFVENNPVNHFDYLGLYTPSFRGKEWTDSQESFFKSRLSDVKRGVKQMLTRTDTLIRKALELKCSLGCIVARDLALWKNFLQPFDRDLTRGEKLPVSVKDLSNAGDGFGSDGQTVFFLPDWLGNGYVNNFLGMRVDPGFFSSPVDANVTLFHELSHASGTIDEDGPSAASTLWSAVKIEGFILEPSQFIPTYYYNLLRQEMGNTECSSSALRWPKN